jgi:hypothetical protein
MDLSRAARWLWGPGMREAPARTQLAKSNSQSSSNLTRKPSGGTQSYWHPEALQIRSSSLVWLRISGLVEVLTVFQFRIGNSDGCRVRGSC